jgi:glycosyltransferase involved in cell wall biosynthesis
MPNGMQPILSLERNVVKILIGVPTHKRPELLRACLESIEALVGVEANVQVLVADNDPQGRAGAKLAGELAGDFPFRLTSTVVEEPGISAVRNAILDEAKRWAADFIAMIDDDATASTDWLSELLRVQLETGADAIGGPVEFVFTVPPPPAVINSRIFWLPSREEGLTTPLNDSANFLVDTRALAKAGWPTFDPDFGLTGGGDSEWFIRLSKVGFRFAWALKAVVHETVPPDRATARWVAKRAFRLGNSSMRIWFRHRSRGFNTLTLGKSALILALAPLASPALLHPVWRAKLTMRWCRAAGKITALLGGAYREYAERHGA